MYSSHAQQRLGYKPQRHHHLIHNPPWSIDPLNKGWGINPSDTPGHGDRKETGQDALNKGWGINPSDTGRVDCVMTLTPIAQQRLGYKPQRHRVGLAPPLLVHRALNKGWGINPSDTLFLGCRRIRCVYPAQQRLGYKPQRHKTLLILPCSGLKRSTKAGV